MSAVKNTKRRVKKNVKVVLIDQGNTEIMVLLHIAFLLEK
jgi:hypothetical protein